MILIAELQDVDTKNPSAREWGNNCCWLRNQYALFTWFMLLAHCWLFGFQPARRVEDDVVYIARMVSDNTEDEDVRDAFFETVIQLWVLHV
jgi:hypothetical protein